jgi:UDP-glucose 4,6-dehydratase
VILIQIPLTNSYKLPVIITRGNNVYGPHQFPEKMIPKFVIRASRGADLPIHGDGEAVRSYLFVEDVARAFDAVLHKVGAGALIMGSWWPTLAGQAGCGG